MIRKRSKETEFHNRIVGHQNTVWHPSCFLPTFLVESRQLLLTSFQHLSSLGAPTSPFSEDSAKDLKNGSSEDSLGVDSESTVEQWAVPETVKDFDSVVVDSRNQQSAGELEEDEANMEVARMVYHELENNLEQRRVPFLGMVFHEVS